MALIAGEEIRAGNVSDADGRQVVNVTKIALGGEVTTANINGTALISSARTANVNSVDINNINTKGVHVVVDVTAINLLPSIVVTIQGKASLSGNYYTILASAAITSISTVVLRVYPGLTAAANLVANDFVPRIWRVSVVAGNADSITYSVGYSLIF